MKGEHMYVTQEATTTAGIVIDQTLLKLKKVMKCSEIIC